MMKERPLYTPYRPCSERSRNARQTWTWGGICSFICDRISGCKRLGGAKNSSEVTTWWNKEVKHAIQAKT